MSSDILASLAEEVDLPWQKTPLGTLYRQLSLWSSVSTTSLTEPKSKNQQEGPSSSEGQWESLAERGNAKRRSKGDGSGYIRRHNYTSRSGKAYEQYYYHYEIWENSSRQVKSCCYIPKARLEQVRKLEANKAPVTKILQVLGKRV
jgi:hypothetical protein